MKHCCQDKPKRTVHAEGGAVSIYTKIKSEDTEITDTRNHRQLFWTVDVFHGRWLVKKGDNDGQGRSRTIVITVAREKKLAFIVLHKNSSLLRKTYFCQLLSAFYSTPQTGKGLISTTVNKRVI